LNVNQVAGPPELFYRESILYLSYTPVSAISAEEQYVLATDMALAALISDDIYNFGEVLSTPVLHTLRETPNSWLYELVVSLHKGDIDVFNNIVDTCRDKYLQQPSLGAKWDSLKQKVVLLGLMNLVFERASHDRTLAFADIAARTRIPTDQVFKVEPFD
jgi:26S proteasome regulatory subunit N9